MLVSTPLTQVSEILQDAGTITWTTSDLLEWMNDAILALVGQKPEVSTVRASVLLVPGPDQTLSGASDLRLVEVVCNMGTSGTVYGKAISEGDASALDDFQPSWRSESGATEIKDYMFDDAFPKAFSVYPPAHATTPVYVQVIKSVLPATLTAYSDTLPVDATYSPALIEWCLYRAFSRDSEQTQNWQRAARHYASFFNLLQIKMTADMSISPKARAMSEKAQ